jgi:hypothetical protein
MMSNTRVENAPQNGYQNYRAYCQRIGIADADIMAEDDWHRRQGYTCPPGLHTAARSSAMAAKRKPRQKPATTTPVEQTTVETGNDRTTTDIQATQSTTPDKPQQATSSSLAADQVVIRRARQRQDAPYPVDSTKLLDLCAGLFAGSDDE